MDFKFSIGEMVTDIVSGYTGIVMDRVQYFHNLNSYSVSKTVKIYENEWFYEQNLCVDI